MSQSDNKHIQLTDKLQTAVASEEDEQIDLAISEIEDQNAHESVIAELGKRLSTKKGNKDQQTVSLYALKALEDQRTINQFGTLILDNTFDLEIRSIALGFLENQIISLPTQTLTYLRSAIDNDEPGFIDRIQATFEHAISEIVGNTTNQKQIFIDAGINPSHLRKTLLKPIDFSDIATIPTPGIFAEALGILGTQEAIDMICGLLSSLQDEQLRDENASQLTESRSPTELLNRGPLFERVMLAAVNALRITESEGAIDCLANALVYNINYKVQRQAADALGKLGFERAISPLFDALFKESNQDLKKKIGDALIEFEDWESKGAQLVTFLVQNSIQREQVDSSLVLSAIQPTQDALTHDPHLVTDFLIKAAVQQFNDERLLQIFAELIKTSTNNNAGTISERLELHRENENISEEILQALRVEIGGAQTLKPVLDQLEKNLLEYFQIPIDHLNSDTQKIWKRTVSLANFGFFMRILFSVSIFGIGAYLMLTSFHAILEGSLSPEQLTAIMVVFIGSGATMFATYLVLPLKEIKQAVVDVGLANVAFISYVHRVLQISHAFSYYYLNGKISFQEIEKSAEQIELTSRDAILTLKVAGSEGDGTQYDQAILNRFKSNDEEEALPASSTESESQAT